MAITKAKKKEIVDDLKNIAKTSKSFVFAEFKGLTVEESMAIRRALRQNGVGFTVAKKSLAERVFGEAGFTGTMPKLDGQFACAYGTDPVEPARGVYDFQKKLDKRIVISGGIFDGAFVGKEQMLQIAEIPPMKTLQGMFVNLINSPIQGLVIALSKVAEKKTA